MGKAEDPCQLQDPLHANDGKSIEVNGHLLGIGAPKPIGNGTPIPNAPDIKPPIPTTPPPRNKNLLPQDPSRRM